MRLSLLNEEFDIGDYGNGIIYAIPLITFEHSKTDEIHIE